MNSLKLIICAILFVGTFALPQDSDSEDSWVEQGATADPGGMPSDLLHGCGSTRGGNGKCSSDIFCPAMRKFGIKEKTKLDCIWGKSDVEHNGATSWKAEGTIAEDYEKTKECEFSVYGNPCVWKKTADLCMKLKKKRMACPWYCNKEELYCAARYARKFPAWEDKPGIVPTGKCNKKDQTKCCTWQLDARYDAKCDPMNWNFRANKKKIIHCRAHAFSRSCNYYYDAALKIHQAKHSSEKGKGEHRANCKKALAFHSCDPFGEPFLGNGYCLDSCGTMSERDGQSGMADTYGADSGCCDVFKEVVKEKMAADKKKEAADDEAVNNGSCKDDTVGLKKDWGPEYTCADCKESGYCEYAFVDDMKKYCAATCKLCGKLELVEETPRLTAKQLEMASEGMQLLAERLRAKENPQPTLIEKYLREGYPDLPELGPNFDNVPMPPN